MKKFILLCSFALLGSFSFGASGIIGEPISFLSESYYAYDEYTVELQESDNAEWPCCKATVYHYGIPVESFIVCNMGSWNCMIAEGYARGYIKGQGGDGWSTTLPIIIL